MAALPKQVRDQVEEANRIASKMGITDVQEDDGVVPEDAADAAEQPVEEQQSAEVAADAETSERVDNDAEEAETPVTAQQQDPSKDAAHWEHKYKTLQGIFNRQLRDNEALQATIDELQAAVEELRKASSTQPVDESAAQAVSRLLSESEVEDYGADLIDVMKRAALEAVQGELDALRKENRQLKEVVGGVGQRQEMSERDRFYSQLAAKVDNWTTINRDQDFLEWLEQEDIYAGRPRKVLLREAFDRNDANRVSRFFLGFLNETAAVNKATTQEPAQHSVQTRGGEKVDLASLAAPGVGASGSADNTGTSSGRMWKESEIGSFYEAARKGRYKGRDEEYRRIEAQIQAAMNEGRILVGR